MGKTHIRPICALLPASRERRSYLSGLRGQSHQEEWHFQPESYHLPGSDLNLKNSCLNSQLSYWVQLKLITGILFVLFPVTLVKKNSILCPVENCVNVLASKRFKAAGTNSLLLI